MYGELMPVLQPTLSLHGPVHDVRTDVEHGRLDLPFGQVLVESVVAAVGTVVEPDPVGGRFGQFHNVGRDLGVGGGVALTVSPPAVRVGRRVGRGEARYGTVQGSSESVIQ